MRRAKFVLVALAASALAGCATWYDRNAYLGTDPIVWFLGGAPTEVQLDWPRREVPTLPRMTSAELVSQPVPRPLDYPRGWSPDNPPYAPFDDALPAPSPETDDSRCNGGCDMAPASAQHARGGDARGEHGTRGD